VKGDNVLVANVKYFLVGLHFVSTTAEFCFLNVCGSQLRVFLGTCCRMGSPGWTVCSETHLDLRLADPTTRLSG